MKYGLPYKEVVFNRKALELVIKVISYKHNWTRGEISNGTKSNRSSEIAWLGDRELLAMLLRMVKKINIDSHWNLSITEDVLTHNFYLSQAFCPCSPDKILPHHFHNTCTRIASHNRHRSYGVGNDGKDPVCTKIFID